MGNGRIIVFVLAAIVVYLLWQNKNSTGYLVPPYTGNSAGV